MTNQFFENMLHETVALLDGTMLESSWNICRFEHHGMPVSLQLQEGPAGLNIFGKIKLQELDLEESRSKVLYAMYMNSRLPEFFQLPIWFAMDPENDDLLACFGLSATDMTAEKMAQVLAPLSELPELDLNPRGPGA